MKKSIMDELFVQNSQSSNSFLDFDNLKMTFDLDKCIAQLEKCELISELDIKVICKRAIEIFKGESNIQKVNSPVTLVGDVHGFVSS